MDILDTTIVNVALPTLSREFNTDTGTIEWVVTGYLWSLALWIPTSGWIGDRFGTRKTFLFAIAMFTVASALCGLAWNIESLVLFRVLQSVGGGMLTPVGTAMLYRAYPPIERARALGVMIMARVVGTKLYPVIGPRRLTIVGLAANGALVGATTDLERAEAYTTAFHSAVIGAVVLAVIGLISAFWLRDEDAAPTMRAASQRTKPAH